MADELTKDEIAELLRHHRPDRYDPEDFGWAAPVIAAIADCVPQVVAREHYAASVAKAVEGRETRRANTLLRAVAESGQMPLDWFEYLDGPLALDGERVCLRAATSDDFERFASRERRAAANDFAARNAACEGALAIAEQMHAQGVELAADLTIEVPA